MDNKIETLQEFIDKAERIVFFGGAGVSTESGIPDFRSVDGLYNQKYDYPPEEILSHTFFVNKPEEFYKFYYDKLLVEGVEPNSAHLKLAELEKVGKLTAVVTQNIDGLHQKAGSENVFELHGSVLRNYCTSCNEFYGIDYFMKYKEKSAECINGSKSTKYLKLPLCEKCNSLVKPDVVLYEEGLDDAVITGAIQAISQADLLIIGGTSLTVYPAAGLINYFDRNKGKLVLINKGSTAKSTSADLVIDDAIGKVFSKIRC